MNRFRIFHRLSHDCNLSIYSKICDNRSVVIIDVNNARFYHNPRMSQKFTSSTFLIRDKQLSTTSSAHNNSTNAKTFRYSSSNKIGRFFVAGGYEDCKLFRRQNSIHAAFAVEPHSYRGVRSFSDSSNAPQTIYPSQPQLDGFWKFLSESGPVEFCQNTLISLHDSTGLPWWATIVLTACGTKMVVTIPLAFYQSYVLAKVAEIKIEMDEIVKQLKIETNYAVHKYKWTESYAREVYTRSVKKQWQKLIERENCHPLKGSVLIVIQLPLWIILSASIRNLCFMLPYPTHRAQEIYLQLMTGGFGWVTNLAAPDHYYVLPIALGIINLTIIEIQNMMRTTEQTKTQKYLTNFFRGGTVAMVLLTSFAPAGIGLYWTSSSALGIVQNLLLMSPRVRRLARISPTEHEHEEPYKHLYTQIKRRIGLEDVSSSKIVKKS